MSRRSRRSEVVEDGDGGEDREDNDIRRVGEEAVGMIGCGTAKHECARHGKEDRGSRDEQVIALDAPDLPPQSKEPTGEGQTRY